MMEQSEQGLRAERGIIPGHQWTMWSAAALLFGITLVFYHGLWLPDQVLIKRDAYRFHLPTKQYLIERLSAGELPQWFPYDGLGRSFIGATATGVFHPFTTLYFLLPGPDAYRASVLISCLLAAFGAFALGRRLGYSPAASLVSGIAFALSGYVVSLTDNIQYLYAICALPLFCVAIEKALVASRAWSVAPGVVWATVLLNGDVQNGYYFGFIGVLWTAARAPRPCREGFLRLALAGGLAILLAGVQLGPSLAVFVGSNRTQPALFHEQAVSWSTHPLRLLSVLASPIGGTASPVAVGRAFFGNPEKGMWAQSLYLGIPVTGLAFLGARHRRDLRVLALLGGVALLLALGRYGGLYEVFYRAVPLWSAFRYPEKLMGVVTFALAMLAGAGLDALRERKGQGTTWLVAAMLCGSAWIGLRTEVVIGGLVASFGASEGLAREVCNSAAIAFLFSMITAVGMWLATWGARTARLSDSLVLVSLAALITLDLGRANLQAYRTAPKELASFLPPLAQAVVAQEGRLALGRFRLISIREPLYTTPLALKQLLDHDAENVERRQALDLEHNTQFHLESALDYLPGNSESFEALFKWKPKMETAARFNVAYFIGSKARLRNPSFANTLVAELLDYNLVLFRNPLPVKPRAYLSLKPERAASPVDATALVARPDFQNGEVDVLETTDATLPGPAKAGRVAIERYAPEEVRIRVEAPQPAVLVLLDTFEAGWQAALEDGVALPIVRANALARAVVVPAGDHVVTFSYQTPLLKAGAGASLIGGLICLAMLGQAVRRTGRSRSAP